MNIRAEYLKTNQNQQYRIEEIRTRFSELYNYIEDMCKNSRETSLALSRLEEAQFWIIKGISREKGDNLDE